MSEDFEALAERFFNRRQVVNMMMSDKVGRNKINLFTAKLDSFDAKKVQDKYRYNKEKNNENK